MRRFGWPLPWPLVLSIGTQCDRRLINCQSSQLISQKLCLSAAQVALKRRTNKHRHAILNIIRDNYLRIVGRFAIIIITIRGYHSGRFGGGLIDDSETALRWRFGDFFKGLKLCPSSILPQPLNREQRNIVASDFTTIGFKKQNESAILTTGTPELLAVQILPLCRPLPSISLIPSLRYW